MPRTLEFKGFFLSFFKIYMDVECQLQEQGEENARSRFWFMTPYSAVFLEGIHLVSYCICKMELIHRKEIDSHIYQITMNEDSR